MTISLSSSFVKPAALASGLHPDIDRSRYRTKKRSPEGSEAGEGNRTLDLSLGSSCFTIKLHLHDAFVLYYESMPDVKPIYSPCAEPCMRTSSMASLPVMWSIVISMAAMAFMLLLMLL